MANFDFALYFEYQSAMELRESDPDEAIRRLNIVREQAISKQNDEWRLIAEHWRTQVTMNWKKDYLTANRLAVETAIESRQEKYKQYQEYICVQNDLLLVYKGIDPVGYAKEVKEAIDLTMDMTTPDMSCHYCMNRDLVDYYIHTGDDAGAREQGAKFFAMTQHHAHYRVQAYEQLCNFAQQDKGWAELLNMAQAGIQLAGELEDESSWIDLKCHEMLALYYLGKLEQAQKAHDLIQYKVSTLKMIQGYNYYFFTSKYQEELGNLPQAINIIEDYIGTLKDTGRPYWECKAQLELIRLLKLSQKSYQNEIEIFKQITTRLRDSAQFNTHLTKILEA